MTNALKDPLLRCFKIICNSLSVPFSEQSCAIGLERVDACVHADTIPIIAKRLGLTAKVNALSFQKLLQSEVPTVFASQDHKLYVLLPERIESEHQLYDAEEDKMQMVGIDKLRTLYAGYVVSLSETTYLEERTQELCKSWERKSWFFSVFKQLKNYLGFILVASLLINIFALCLPVFIMNVYDRVVPYNAWTTLRSFATAIVLIIIFEFVITWIRGFLLGHFSPGVNQALSISLFEKTIRLKLCDAPISSGVFLQTRRNFMMIKELITSLSLSTFIDLPFSLFFLVMIAYIGGDLVYIPIFGLIALSIIHYLLGPIITESMHKQSLRDSQQEALQMNALNHLETIKSTNASQFFERRFKAAIYLGGNLALDPLVGSLSQALPLAINHLCLALLVVFGAQKIMGQEISVGALVACSIFCARALMAGQVSGFISRVMTVTSIIKDLDTFMNQDTEENDRNQHLIDDKTAKGDISFDKVSFYYPNSPQPALANINCTIKSGELVAIIGQTGSGKSTLSKCLTNLYTPQTGMIRFDHIPVDHITPSNLRHLIHYVSPQGGIIYGTIRENLLFSAPNTSEEKLQEVIKLTGLDRLIQRHTQGIDLTIGDNASYLSAGEVQLITIVRALLSDAKVLILDEPTANVDSITGTNLIRNIIQYVNRKKTLIMITHRSTLFGYFDRIIVMKDGSIINDGPAKKLLKDVTE